MKSNLLLILLILPLALSAQEAKIQINTARSIGPIDRNIYGVFMEPIQFSGRRMGLPDSVRFNTMYGTLYDPSSPLADENGFKRNYIDAMKELKITNMRWPGGNYVAGYDWQDGIGPKEQRPVRKDLAWGAIENNHVGTDEWVQLNRAIGSENVVCINLGLGNINDARYWVEYCNLEGGTYYSDLRAKYGHPKPYQVKYWCLGNEVDGSPWIMGYKNAEDYTKIALEAAKAMRATDPEITFIANGSSYYEATGKWIDWNWKVISELTGVAEYLSIHRYWERSDDYYTYIGQGAFDIEEKITTVQAQVNTAKVKFPDKKPMQLSVDEWAPFGQTMRSTLAVAQYLNSFIRHADFVKMANFTLLTSLLGSDRAKGTFKTPLFYTFKMFSNNCIGTSIDTYVQCDTFNTQKFKGIPYLDVTTVLSEDSSAIYVNVVNRHLTKGINAEVINNSGTFTGKAQASSISHEASTEVFSIDNQDKYLPVILDVSVQKSSFTYTFPPHSFTQIKVGVKKM